ncbi:hypothetical protein GCM10010495_19010 [Kitasatospora herbaricolor]|uniref:hypothetical protein n=1 Tax=Kitasatospora herbaricolor TaxID=68217 RepID=UPI0017497DE8|nr:hypothetical protein [Kitasatospora herbaricolor]MDQ0308347.1 hypothetical protein [Kitasatospora herbaricolor]GGV06840.1 hypothetical protein GCM10010495_19010 [Kitasatospora herbaricolor]
MTAMFDEELREQLARAREELAAARAAADADGVQAYLGRVASLLRLASQHGIELPHTAEEEQGES